MKKFDNKQDAFKWMHNWVNSHYVTNTRFAYTDHVEGMTEYERKVSIGKDGSFDEKIIVNDKEATIGCNYGH